MATPGRKPRLRRLIAAPRALVVPGSPTAPLESSRDGASSGRPAPSTPLEIEIERLNSRLRERGTIGTADPAMVRHVAMLVCLIDQMAARIAAEGMTVSDERGERVHPLVAQIGIMTARVRVSLRELGLTPAGARGDVESVSSDVASRWDGLIGVA